MKTFKNITINTLIIAIIALSPMLFFACGEQATLSVYQNFKNEYYVGETLDITDGILKYTENGEDNFFYIEEDMISDFSTETVGNKIMTITYKGVQIKYTYTVMKVLDVKDNTDYFYEIKGIEFVPFIKFDLQNNKCLMYVTRETPNDDKISEQEYNIERTQNKDVVRYILTNINDSNDIREIWYITENGFSLKNGRYFVKYIIYET